MTERASQLLARLGAEIRQARAGSDQGQFPILDLIGNLRDEFAAGPEWAAVHATCAQAWEKMVRIVESGQPFSRQNVEWLNTLLAGLENNPEAPRGQPPAPEPEPVPPAAAPAPEIAPAPAGVSIAPEIELNLNLDSDADLLREFITESREHLDNIEQGVLVLEKHPDNAEMLNTVFRAFHTFKGGAGFLNLVPINRLAHILESLLDLARQGRFVIASPAIELILRGRDVLKHFLDEIEGQVGGAKPATPIIIPTEVLKAEVAEMIELVSAGKIPGAAAPPAEISPATPATPTPETAASAAQSAGGNAMVRVDTSKLDGLLDLVGEMVIAQSLVAPNLARLSDGDAQFSRNVAQLNRITRDLQRVSMSLRMVPIRGLFQKMARVARDISAKQNKKVDFMTSGEDTELDRSVVEELNDPAAPHDPQFNGPRHRAGGKTRRRRQTAGWLAAPPRLSPGRQHRRRNRGRRRRAEPRPHPCQGGRTRPRRAGRASDGRRNPSASSSPPDFPRRKKSPTFPGAAWAWTWCAVTSRSCAARWAFRPRRARARCSKSRCR